MVSVDAVWLVTVAQIGGEGIGPWTYFQIRCQPKDIRSFMRSYDSATLWKTPATRSVFSDSDRPSWNPKCVVRGLPLLLSCVDEVVLGRRAGVLVLKVWELHVHVGAIG